MMRASLSDQQLISLYLSGDEAAFETLLNRHQQQVYSKIFFIVRDNDLANDLFQDTFIKVVNTLKSGKYNEEGKFLPWVMRIAHNLSIDHFRRGKKMRMLRATEEFDVFDTMQTDELHAEDQIIQDQIHQDVRDLLETLPEEQQIVVRMRIERDMSFQEIADETGVSINTALGRMRYALINLRKSMEEQGIQLTLN
ncbi:MAG: sigma-70 family RNA polymerase sigma factor [Bacteroidetes bacterium]|nr:sigma-70 family RNA polymerase sigma factor [Bacteroidota bacterium]MDA1336215.1 sigma-70 family RNA polymerase sigma factor [Bacteroidota bacterium]